MPIRPELLPILEVANAMPLFNAMPLAEARRLISQPKPWSREVPGLASVEDRVIDGPAGTLPVRVYRPASREAEVAGLLPLVVYFHGGGFLLGDLEIDDSLCREYCAGAGCVVLSVGYRLAPEHKFPAGAMDCLAATRWALGPGAAELSTDPRRTVTAGMSAGGNLATVVALQLRDLQTASQGTGPGLAGQLLLVPVTDYSGDPETASYRENARGYMLPAEEMYWFWREYLNDPAERFNPYAAPLRASDLSGLPPALVITAEFDVLRDEGEAYARRLREAGCAVQAIRCEGMNHLVSTFTAVSDVSRQAVADQVAWLKQVFATALAQG